MSTSAARVASLFDQESAGYDDAHEGPQGHALRTRIAAVLEAVGPGPGDALDAGMGPGRLVAELAECGWRVSGIDISASMVELARRRVPSARERLSVGSIDALPFADRSFDRVAAIGVVEYLDDPAAGLAELVRVLRPDGLLVISMPNLASLRSRWSHDVWYPAVRLAKRRMPGFRRPAPYAKSGLLGVEALAAATRAAGAEPVSIRHLVPTVLPRPLGAAAPALDRWLAARTGGESSRAARALSAQILITAQSA